jgi:hypothetical protein
MANRKRLLQCLGCAAWLSNDCSLSRSQISLESEGKPYLVWCNIEPIVDFQAVLAFLAGSHLVPSASGENQAVQDQDAAKLRAQAADNTRYTRKGPRYAGIGRPCMNHVRYQRCSDADTSTN